MSSVITDLNRRVKNVRLIIEGNLTKNLIEFLENSDIVIYVIALVLYEENVTSLYIEFNKVQTIRTINNKIKPTLVGLEYHFKERTKSKVEMIRAYAIHSHKNKNTPFLINKRLGSIEMSYKESVEILK
jgi:hypothetical protein